MSRPLESKHHPPKFHYRPFECPVCGEMTAVQTPLEFIAQKRTSCLHCGQEFEIVNDHPRMLSA